MSSEAERRWRLALGRYANTQLGGLSGKDGETDRVLDYLYAREYQKRGVQFGKGPGSLDPTQMNALNWLGQARQLFPNSVFETLQAHALDRYGITDLLKDPKTFDGLEPNPALLKTLLSFDGRAQPQVKEKLRAISREIIEEIMRRLKMKVERAFSGRRDRFRSSHLKSVANFDWRRTVRENLKTWDPEKQRLMVEQLRFNARQRRRLPWKIILCIDQSGSMTDSLIHSAVMAAILSGLPGITVKMVLFDTSIIDVSEKLTDPLETLLSVQLGGGTDIGRAVQYCETLVTEPARTVFVLVTDFCEGASPRALYAAIARLAEARVRLLGLTALDESGVSEFDPNVAHRCADLGMHVAAMTPDRLADWLAGIVQ